MTIKDSKFGTVYKVNPLCLIFIKMNGFFEEINRNKYLTLVPTNETKEEIKQYEELWIKNQRFNISITKNSDNYAKKYIKIRI